MPCADVMPRWSPGDRQTAKHIEPRKPGAHDSRDAIPVS